MTNFKDIGFEVIYPKGCKELSEGLKEEELKRRLNELIRSLEMVNSENPMNQDSLLCGTTIDNEDNLLMSCSSKFSAEQYKGLLYHLCSEQFLDHADAEVQLRVASCICILTKIFSAEKLFKLFTEPTSLIKIVVDFLLKCLNHMVSIKSVHDKIYVILYKIFSNCCESDIFNLHVILDTSDVVLTECVHVFYNIARKFSEWDTDKQSVQLITDFLINLLNQRDAVVPEKLLSFILNFLADRSAPKVLKSMSMEILSRCYFKLEEQIQMLFQNYLLKSVLDDEDSDDSDRNNDNENNDDDDLCSIDSYKLKQTYRKRMAAECHLKPKKTKFLKNTLDSCLEYSCDHTFQLIFEMFKINESIVSPLLPMIGVKLTSTDVTDRKRTCRLLGKLFTSSNQIIMNNQSALWESFLGRFCDIEVEVREICVRIACDVLKIVVSGNVNIGCSAIVNFQDDLVKSLCKRSHDQDETIKLQVILASFQILDVSNRFVSDNQLDSIHDSLFKLLIERSRDRTVSIRTEANISLGKLYRKIVNDIEARFGDSSDLTLGLRHFNAGQLDRTKLLINTILRLYFRTEIDDRVIMERLFNTSLVPYSESTTNRMKSLVQCFTLCDDVCIKSIHEMFKNQVIIMNFLRETVGLIKDLSSEKALTSSMSIKLREKTKRVAEFLPNRDKIDSLTKFFGMVKSDNKLLAQLSIFVDPDSSRQIIVKSIAEIKKIVGAHLTKMTIDAGKKKSIVQTAKCLLERAAPVVIDSEIGSELVAHFISAKEAIETRSMNFEDHLITVPRALSVLHGLLLLFKKYIPIRDVYEYALSVTYRIRDINVDKHIPSNELPSTQFSLEVEELCLLIFGKLFCDLSIETSHDHDDNREFKIQEPSLFSENVESMVEVTLAILPYFIDCCKNGTLFRLSPDNVLFTSTPQPSLKKDHKRFLMNNQMENVDVPLCLWKYNCKIAKLSSLNLIKLYSSVQQQIKAGNNISEIIKLNEYIEKSLDDLINYCRECVEFSEKHPMALSTLTQMGFFLSRKYGSEVKSYVQDVVLRRLLIDEETESKTADEQENFLVRDLSCWIFDGDVDLKCQVRVQSLRLLSRWMVTLKAEDDRNLIFSVMICLRKYIGTYSDVNQIFNISDGIMSHLRLAAGKCWLKLAQVQSFLPIIDIKWLNRLSGLVYDPCPQVRDEFLNKLHKGLYWLKLPLDYMAMFALVPSVGSLDFQNRAKSFFTSNVTRRREFLERNPHYMIDAKLLFAVLPEYVLAFVIHMLAHDFRWTNIDDMQSLSRIKESLWFVMEPIIKPSENCSFIRKLLEKIKHAQDAVDPTNKDINEKIYVCCDISLGLLLTKQTTYELKEYPVELKLPRTRFVPASDDFFNPEFSNIIDKDSKRVRIQFSPVSKSKNIVKNVMPIELIKGGTVPTHQDSSDLIHLQQVEVEMTVPDSNNQQQQTIQQLSPQKSKKQFAKIIVAMPEMEIEQTLSKVVQPIVRKAVKHKTKQQKPEQDLEEMDMPSALVSKRGRLCKPNVRVMKDMVSPTKRTVTISHQQQSSIECINTPIQQSSVRLEGTVCVSLERLPDNQSEESALKYGVNEIEDPKSILGIGNIDVNPQNDKTTPDISNATNSMQRKIKSKPQKSPKKIKNVRESNAIAVRRDSLRAKISDEKQSGERKHAKAESISLKRHLRSKVPEKKYETLENSDGKVKKKQLFQKYMDKSTFIKKNEGLRSPMGRKNTRTNKQSVQIRGAEIKQQETTVLVVNSTKVTSNSSPKGVHQKFNDKPNVRTRSSLTKYPEPTTKPTIPITTLQFSPKENSTRKSKQNDSLTKELFGTRSFNSSNSKNDSPKILKLTPKRKSLISPNKRNENSPKQSSSEKKLSSSAKLKSSTSISPITVSRSKRKASLLASTILLLK